MHHLIRRAPAPVAVRAAALRRPSTCTPSTSSGGVLYTQCVASASMSHPPRSKRVCLADAAGRRQMVATTTDQAQHAVPARPAPLVTMSNGIPAEDLASIKRLLEADSGARDEITPMARLVSAAADNAVQSLLVGDYEDAVAEMAAARAQVDATLDKVDATDAKMRWFLRGHPAIVEAMEKFVLGSNLATFLTTGGIMARGEFARQTDEEYLLGLIGLTHQLSRYAVGRGTVGDAASVVLCCELVTELYQHFLAFDLRNGDLRRRYDSLKYQVRKLEDLLYELSLTGAHDPGGQKREEGGGPVKFVGAAEDFPVMAAAMDAYDKEREEVIKQTRDVQKAAKQAIFSLHRADMDGAEAKLTQAAQRALQIKVDFLEKSPTLRGGSYAGAVEEFVEARLFQAWLQEDGAILGPSTAHFAALNVQPHEYLGGLADFTGEVGRFAVQSAVQRDEVAVRKALAAVLAVQRLWTQLGLTGKLSKKEGELNQNVKKLENVLYELSLVKATGRKVQASSTAIGEDTGRADKKDDDN